MIRYKLDKVCTKNKSIVTSQPSELKRDNCKTAACYETRVCEKYLDRKKRIASNNCKIGKRMTQETEDR